MDWKYKYIKYKTKYLQLAAGKPKIILITGLSGSGKTTLGKKIKKLFKDMVVIDTDTILDESFIELYEGNKKFRKMIETKTGNPRKMHDKLLLKKRDELIKKHQGETIVFTGMTVPLDGIPHKGYFLDVPFDVIFRRKNLRELETICSQKDELVKMYKTENLKVIDELAEFKMDIRGHFPLKYHMMKRFYKEFKKDMKKKGYKVMSGEEIIKDIAR